MAKKPPFFKKAAAKPVGSGAPKGGKMAIMTPASFGKKKR